MTEEFEDFRKMQEEEVKRVNDSSAHFLSLSFLFFVV